MSYIEQYEDARTKIQDTRKCITHPENILVCYLPIYYLTFIKYKLMIILSIYFLIIKTNSIIFSQYLIHQLLGLHFCLEGKLMLLLQ